MGQLIRARLDKETKYAELVAGNRCRLVVVALETGGRWSNEAIEFVDMLAGARAREALPVLRRSVHLAWRRRWTRNSLVQPCVDVWSGTDGPTPDLTDLFGEA